MRILVCPLSKVPQTVADSTPDRVVSLLDPGFSFPELGSAYSNRHLRLSFHDIHVSTKEQIMPSAEHINDLLTFLAEWDRSGTILIHCRAGIGRSTATAFIAACLHNPSVNEHEIAVRLRRVSPLARPNATLIRLADHAMKRSDRMSQAIADTGRDLPTIDVDEGEPFAMPSMFEKGTA